MSKLALNLLILICLLITSCIPFYIDTYLEPSSEGGQLERGRCHSGATAVNFQLGEVSLSVSAEFNSKNNKVFLRLYFTNTKMNLIMAPAKPLLISHLGEIFFLKKFYVTEFTENSDIKIKQKRKVGQNDIIDSKSFMLEFQTDISINNQESFNLELPNIVIGKGFFNIPPINFTSKTDTCVLPPINN